MKVKAYAKINLGLRVLGKRDDGFHELEMIMINVGVYDILNFKLSDNVCVFMDKEICDMKDNIVYKTAIYIKEKYSVEKGVKINIKKRIPDGGGMGGGSSDAASTIIALNKIWNLSLNKEEMIEIASKIGSDVPFFIENRLSFVRGRGEKIEVINKNLNDEIILCFPDMKCSTKEIFQNYICKEEKKSILDIYKNLNDRYFDYLFNDLEETVFRLYPNYVLIELKKEIEQKFDCKVLMSGSGSSFFILGDGCVKKIYKYLRKKYKNFRIIKNKTISYCKNGIN